MSQVDPSNQERARSLLEARELRIYLRTVGDVVRLQILRQLAQSQEMSVTKLVKAVRVSQPLLSWHLGVLRRVGLVSVRKEGRLVWYSLDGQVLRSFRRRFDAWVRIPEDADAVGEGEKHA